MRECLFSSRQEQFRGTVQYVRIRAEKRMEHNSYTRGKHTVVTTDSPKAGPIHVAFKL